MPHVIIKIFPGKTEAQKQALADAAVREVAAHLGGREGAVSVAIEEIPKERWKEEVFDPEIRGREDILLRRPDYEM